MHRLAAVWYESRPYLCLVIGLVAMLFSSTPEGFAFSALLVGVALAILRLRRTYRSPERQKVRKYGRRPA